MSASDTGQGGADQMNSASGGARPAPATAFRLYIARATPNSVRAEQNLDAALEALRIAGTPFTLEVIDVFVDAKRAIRDGVIVTPTLIIAQGHSQHTIVGDLTRSEELAAVLRAYSH